MFHGKIFIPIFECTVKVVIAPNDVSMLRSINYYLRKRKDSPWLTPPEAAFMVEHNDYSDSYILFFNKKNLTVNLINHEKSHVLEQILLDRQIRSTGEVRSYLDGWFSNKLTLLFRDNGFKPYGTA